jgi:hypothetical protein
LPFSVASTVTHRLQHGDPDPGEPAAANLRAAEPREDRGLEALDAHRHDHRARFLGDHCSPVIDLHQLAGDSDAPLRQIRRRLRRLRDKEAGTPAQYGDEHHGDGESGGIAAVLHREAARYRAAEDCEKGGAFDQGIARRQFLALQMIRKDAVFDRPEQRPDQAEQKQRDEQKRQRLQLETGDGNAGRADFDELQQARYQRLVETIGELPA